MSSISRHCRLPDPELLLFGLVAWLKRYWRIGCCGELLTGAGLILAAFVHHPRPMGDLLGLVGVWLIPASMTLVAWVTLRMMAPLPRGGESDEPSAPWDLYRAILPLGWLVLSIAAWLVIAGLLLHTD